MSEEEKRLNRLQILVQEQQHKIFAEDKFRKLLDNLDQAYDLFLQTILEAKKKIDENSDPEYHRVYLKICMKINSDLRTTYRAVLYGWYASAEASFREFNDAINKIIYISEFQNGALQIEKSEINYKGIKKKLKEKGIKSPLSKRAWGQISGMKHAEESSIIAYGDFSDMQTKLRFIPTIFAYLIENLLIFLIALVLEAVNQYSNHYNKRYGSNPPYPFFNERLKALNEIITALMKTYIENLKN